MDKVQTSGFITTSKTRDKLETNVMTFQINGVHFFILTTEMIKYFRNCEYKRRDMELTKQLDYNANKARHIIQRFQKDTDLKLTLKK